MTKPEDLKSPFSQKEAVVMIDDRIFYIPEKGVDYNSFTFPAWSSPSIFGNENPIHIEYCSGNGTWIAAKAAENPDINWVAVERRFVRARKIWSKMKNLKLNNLFIVCGEAYKCTLKYLPSCSVSKIFINFPDPWPKRRHAGHRLIRPAFLDELSRIAKEKNQITLVTDDPVYSDKAIAEIHSHQIFRSIHPEPFYITEKAGYGTSFFEELWRQKGKIIRYHTFGKSEG